MKRFLIAINTLATIVGSVGVLYLTFKKDLVGMSCGGDDSGITAGISCEAEYSVNPGIWLFVSVLAISILGFTYILTNKKFKQAKSALTARIPIYVSGIVFTIVLISNIAIFTPLKNCETVHSNARDAGNMHIFDVERTCTISNIDAEPGYFVYLTIISALLALAVSIVTWGVVRVFVRQKTTAIKKIGLIALLLGLTVTIFFILGSVHFNFSKETLYADQPIGQVFLITYLIVSTILSLTVMRALSTPKTLRTK